MNINWQKEIKWKIKLGELVAVLLAYLLFCILYAFTLAINESAYSKEPFITILNNYIPNQIIDYTLKFLITIPLWYFYFRVIGNWSILSKISWHFCTIIVFVFGWQQTFYFITEALGRGHLRGSSQVWDIYIPALFYILQFCVFHAFEYYSAFQKQKEIELKLVKANLQSELTAIKAQLNPHFLYNVFNSISASVPPEMEETREMIATLADMFRYILRASKEDFVLLKEEIDFIEKYLSLEKNRFGERLTSEIIIDSDVLNAKIPPMILQPLVENSIKHGLSSLIEGGKISIIVSRNKGKIRFEISDTGVGVIDKKGIFNQGIGLTNTQLRLEKIYHSALEITDNQPKGLKIAFEI